MKNFVLATCKIYFYNTLLLRCLFFFLMSEEMAPIIYGLHRITGKVHQHGCKDLCVMWVR